MTWAEVKAWLDEHRADQDVTDYFAGQTKVTPEGVRAFLDTDEGKRILQPLLDSHFSKGLETWKQNNLDKLVQEKYTAEHPAEDEKDKAIRELRAEIETEKKERIRASLRANAIAKATEKGLPVDVVDHFLGEDDATTEANLGKLETVFNMAVTAEVEKRFKSNGRPPKKDDDDPEKQPNPWKKDNFNLTKQGEVTKTNPELAAKLKAAAGAK